jgi:nucleotide-binding universal stress UspA family protein
MPDHAWATPFDDDANNEQYERIVSKMKTVSEAPGIRNEDGEIDAEKAAEWAKEQAPKIWAQIDATVRKKTTPATIEKNLKRAGEYDEVNQ